MMAEDRTRFLILEIIGAVFVSICAVLFHFMYKWSGENFFVGLITATNESVFEHTKILFFPYVIYSVIEYFLVKVDPRRFIVAKSITAVMLFALVIVVFYIYSGIIGYNITAVDIISTFVYTFIAFFTSYKLITGNSEIERHIKWAVPLFLVVLFAEFFFTMYPPKIQLFFDTESKIYGMEK